MGVEGATVPSPLPPSAPCARCRGERYQEDAMSTELDRQRPGRRERAGFGTRGGILGASLGILLLAGCAAEAGVAPEEQAGLEPPPIVMDCYDTGAGRLAPCPAQ